MSETTNQRTRNPFKRSTGFDEYTPIRAAFVRNATAHSQSVFATGRHHFSVWLGEHGLTGSMTMTDKGYWTKITPYSNASYLQLVFLIQPVGSDAELQIVTDTANKRDIPSGHTSVDVVSNLEEVIFEYGVTGGVEADIYFATDGDYLVKALSVYDSPLSVLVSTDTGHVDMSDIYRRKELTTTVVQAAVTCQTTILSNLRKVHVNMAPLIHDEAAETVTCLVTWANFFDTSVSVYNQTTSPGFWVRPGAAYHNQRHTKLKCRVKAASSSTNAKVRFVSIDEQYSDEIAISSGSATWYTGYLYIQTPYSYGAPFQGKVDLQCIDASAGTLDIYNVIIEEMDVALTSGDTFRVLDTEIVVPSVDNLDPRATLNSVTKDPELRYHGADASATALEYYVYGKDLAIAGSGSELSLNRGCPGQATADDSVKGNAGKYLQSSDNTYADITTEDIVVRAWIKPGTGTDQRIFDKRGTTGAGYYLTDNNGSDQAVLFVSDGTDTASIASPTLVPGYWYLLTFILDRSGSGICYTHTRAGSAVSLTSVDSLTNTDMFTIFADSDGGNKSNAEWSLLELWIGTTWLDTHLQVAFDKENLFRLAGLWPQIAEGTEVPTSYTRNSIAYLEKRESGISKWYGVGEHWPRVEGVLDGSDTAFIGYRSESEDMNHCLQSEDKSTTWTKVNGGDTVSINQLAAPDGATTMDAIIADATDTQHGFTQNITLTAEPWFYSEVVSKGDKNWVRLRNSTIANCDAYFDIANGVLGTVGAGATAEIIDLGSDRYLVAIMFTGTVAAHTFQALSALADTDDTFAGDGSTKNTYFWGSVIGKGAYPFSYIKTTTSSQTRVADNLYFKGDDGNLGDQLGTIVAGFLHRAYTPAAVENLITISDGGAAADCLNLRMDTGKHLEIYCKDGGVEQVHAAGSTDACDDDDHKARARYHANHVWGLLDDASEIAEDTACTIPNDIDRIHIGCDEAGVNQFRGWIRKVRAKAISTSL